MNLKTLATGVGLLAIATSCSNDVTEEVNLGSEISFTTRMSRADVINSVADLKEFVVYAEAENYNGLFIDAETATQDSENSGIFNLKDTYRWPSDANTIEFWAYAPKEPATGTTINIAGSHQAQITGFQPAVYSEDNTNAGALHKDLIVAYTKASKAQSSSGVKLDFKHTLSQIELKAKLGNGNKNKYDVKVKGAWFVNIFGKGDISFDASDTNTNQFTWTNDNATKALYGRYSETPISLSLTATDLLSNSNGKSGLMVIPQLFQEWNTHTDKENNNGGAYIMILCRIEVTHNGDEHTGDYVKETSGGHIHQMFPTPDNDKTFNENLYGYVCVPLTNTEGGWQAGKKYVYTLEFCGANSGAGLYPPTGDIDYPEKPVNPGDKEPGDPIFDEPIKFSVSVTEWDNSWNTPDENGSSAGDIPMN